MQLLEDLTAPKVTAPQGWQPAITFDGTTGEATTPGITGQPDLKQYLIDAGYDPDEIEVIGNIRTSRWQKYDGEWLTAYRFSFNVKHNNNVDLPLLWASAKKNAKKFTKPPVSDKALVIALSDFQIGKVDERGGTEQLITRILESYDRIEKHVRKNPYEKFVLCDVGDIVEGFANSADMQQAVTNDMSLMQQVDLGITLVWDLIKRLTRYAPVQYVSIASNHCQFRLNKQRVGKPGQDDWGLHIARQLHRLATETDLPVTVHTPHPNDESLAIDVFGNQQHILGLIHGHQVSRPDGFPDFWRKQAFGKQPIHAATICLSGHFHHTRIQELGDAGNGGSRYWIQAPTMDSGSGWYRLNSGEDSKPGIAYFELHKDLPFTGTVWRT